MADEEDIQEISGNESDEFTSDDEEEEQDIAEYKDQDYLPPEENEQEVEDKDDGFPLDEANIEGQDGGDKEHQGDQDNTGAEDKDKANDQAKQKSGAENILDDSSASSTDPFSAETEVGGVKVTTSQAVAAYVPPVVYLWKCTGFYVEKEENQKEGIQSCFASVAIC